MVDFVDKNFELPAFDCQSIRSSTVHRTRTNSQSVVSNELDPNIFLISSNTNSHNTIRKTKHDVKRFIKYIDEQLDEQTPLHTLSAEFLSRYLTHYFENTKKFDGTEYEPDTLRSFLLSIERYLKSTNYQWNLLESPRFQSCRQIIANKREEWKKNGSKHASINLVNMKNLIVFDRSKPDGLLAEIYMHILNLSPLSIEALLWGEITLIKNEYLVCNQHQNIRLSATPHQPSTCPVQAYVLYATHRPSQCNTPQSPFFLMPRSTNTHPTWYKTTPVGKHFEQVLQNATLIKPSIPAKRMKTSIQSFRNFSVSPGMNDDSDTGSSSSTNSPFSSSVKDFFIQPNPTPIWDESVTDILLTIATQRDTRRMKINTLRAHLEEKLGFIEFLCLYRDFKSEPKFTFSGTPWEHYQHFLPVLLTLLTLDNTTV